MAARANIHGLNLIWDPLIKRWILEDVDDIEGMLCTVWKNTDYDLDPKYKITREKNESAWIKHDGSNEVPEGLRDALVGCEVEAWTGDGRWRVFVLAESGWRYYGSSVLFGSWSIITHYRRPQRPEDA